MALPESGAPEVLPIDASLELRQLTQADAEALYETIDADRAHLGEWMGWVQDTQDPSDTADYIAGTEQAREAGRAYGYGIIQESRIVGHISLLNLVEADEPTKIGYWVSSEATRHGIGTRVTEAITELATETLQEPEVNIFTAEDNKASNRVAEKAGYDHAATRYDERLGYRVNQWVRRTSEDI